MYPDFASTVAGRLAFADVIVIFCRLRPAYLRDPRDQKILTRLFCCVCCCCFCSDGVLLPKTDSEIQDILLLQYSTSTYIRAEGRLAHH